MGLGLCFTTGAAFLPSHGAHGFLNRLVHRERNRTFRTDARDGSKAHLRDEQCDCQNEMSEEPHTNL